MAPLTDRERAGYGMPLPRRKLRSYLMLFMTLIMSCLVLVFWSVSYYPDVAETWYPSWDNAISGTGPISAQFRKTRSADVEKRNAVVGAFKHAWSAYERDAMGSDEYHPISNRGENISSKSSGVGYTVLDAIDTMYIMGLDAEYSRARYWVKTKLVDFDVEGVFSTFETTIRVLGGLLTMVHLSETESDQQLYLSRAIDLGDRLLTAFDTKLGLPLPSVNLANTPEGKKGKGVPDSYSPSRISTAEATTLQLEFKYLSHLTGNMDYWKKAEKAMQVVRHAVNQRENSKLVPIHMNVDSGDFAPSDIRLGSRGDSYYEYLLKQYIQTNRTESVYLHMYNGAMESVHHQLVQKTLNRGLTYIAELVPRGRGYALSPKQDHLVCFLAGSLMLGSAVQAGGVKSDWDVGKELLETCVDTYFGSETGLSPEISMFVVSDADAQKAGKRDWYIKGHRKGSPAPYDARYMLRPETVESIFIAYRLTGAQKYRDYAWRIFQAIEKHCKLPGGGYATLIDVDGNNGGRKHLLEDKQETFFLSETLKYLYLTFTSSDVLSLDEYVFNTEAHPFPIFNGK